MKTLLLSNHVPSKTGMHPLPSNLYFQRKVDNNLEIFQVG